MSTQKKKLLKNLKSETYCRIGVSKIHKAGVGVIAIKDIPAGVDPFKLSGGANNPNHKMTKIKKEDFADLPKEVQKMLKDFIQKESNGSFYVPSKDNLSRIILECHLVFYLI